jgi:two-component system, response regulator YesN
MFYIGYGGEEMFRILVVDDEPFIVQGLYTLLNDMEDLEVDVYKANSAKEALELLKKIKIDIVLTDINMPNMSGIQLHKEIMGQWPRCRVIFLTGYDEFEYVQSAIRQGAFDYVLKIERDEVIVEAVRKAMSSINSDMQKEALLENARRSMRLALPSLRERYINDLLSGSEVSSNERERQFTDIEMPLNYDMSVMIIVGNVDIWTDNVPYTRRMEVFYGIQSIVEEYLGSFSNIVSVIYNKDQLVWILQPKDMKEDVNCNYEVDDLWQRLILFINGYIDTIQNVCRELYSITVSFAVSSGKTDWDNISEKFDILKLRLNESSGINNGVLVTDSAFSPKPERVKEDEFLSNIYKVRSNLKKIGLLETYLERGQKSEFLLVYNEIMGTVESGQLTRHSIAIEVYYSISALFLSYINKLGLNESISRQFDLLKINRIGRNFNWREVDDFFKKLAGFIFDQKRDDYLDKTERIVRYLEDYIDSNLSGDVSLVKLADLVHFNATYLSRFYKQVTGKSLSDYITEVKLIKAKEMLSDSRVKINEVASAVGFDNSSYFSRFFKKATNLTPQEYRDNLEKRVPSIGDY